MEALVKEIKKKISQDLAPREGKLKNGLLGLFDLPKWPEPPQRNRQTSKKPMICEYSKKYM
jgi:hypothetical protein